nr:serine/arginine repetitive matrix protein 1-like [Aegilops tauschii subsp. strangulata]
MPQPDAEGSLRRTPPRGAPSSKPRPRPLYNAPPRRRLHPVPPAPQPPPAAARSRRSPLAPRRRPRRRPASPLPAAAGDLAAADRRFFLLNR